MNHINNRLLITSLTTICLSALWHSSAQEIDRDPPGLRHSLDRLDRADRAGSAGAAGFTAGTSEGGIPVVMNLEVAGTYDSNALGMPGGGPNDWHFDWEATVKARVWSQEKFSADLLGIYTGSLYDTFTSEDYQALGVGPTLGWAVTPSFSIRLSDMMLWALSSDFDDTLFTRNRLTLAATKEFSLVEEVLSLSITPSVRRDFYIDAGTDRTRAGLNVELAWTLSERLSLAPGATWSYTWIDGGGHFSDLELYSDLRYQFYSRDSGFIRNLAVTARVYYLNRDNSGPTASMNQFTVAPVLSLSAKF